MTIMSAATWATAPSDIELARVLQHRYGDGTVYLLDRGAKQIFGACLQLELVSDEGFITKKGRELLARYGL